MNSPLINLPFSKRLLTIGMIVLVLTVLSVSSYFAFQKYFVHKTPSIQSTDTEYSKILDQLAKLTDLPAGEEPTIATVSDKEKLQEQAFFSQAENGDKVIIYQNAKKAYLYRPSTNKIIGIAPINIESQEASDSSRLVDTRSNSNVYPSTEPQASGEVRSLKVAILNATQIKGLAKSAQVRIEKEIPQIEVISTGNSQDDYSKTLIINMTGQNSSTLESLVKLSQGELTSTFPSGETKPNVDVLLILGPDYGK